MSINIELVVFFLPQKYGLASLKLLSIYSNIKQIIYIMAVNVRERNYKYGKGVMVDD